MGWRAIKPTFTAASRSARLALRKSARPCQSAGAKPSWNAARCSAPMARLSRYARPAAPRGLASVSTKNWVASLLIASIVARSPRARATSGLWVVSGMTTPHWPASVSAASRKLLPRSSITKVKTSPFL